MRAEITSMSKHAQLKIPHLKLNATHIYLYNTHIDKQRTIFHTDFDALPDFIL